MIPLKIKATGRVSLTPEVQSFLEEKLLKLEKLVDPTDTTVLAEVELEALPHKTGDAFRVELNFSSNGKMFRVEAKREALHPAIDEAIEEASRRLRHVKGKSRDRERKGAFDLKQFFRNFPGF